MLKKVYHWIFSLCTIAGFLLLIGTAGASDNELIDFTQIVIQTVIALVLMIVGYIGLKSIDCKYID